MENKEKVMKVLKALKTHYYSNSPCKDCPYFGKNYCLEKLLQDLFDLLEQP